MIVFCMTSWDSLTTFYTAIWKSILDISSPCHPICQIQILSFSTPVDLIFPVGKQLHEVSGMSVIPVNASYSFRQLLPIRIEFDSVWGWRIIHDLCDIYCVYMLVVLAQFYSSILQWLLPFNHDLIQEHWSKLIASYINNSFKYFFFLHFTKDFELSAIESVSKLMYRLATKLPI